MRTTLFVLGLVTCHCCAAFAEEEVAWENRFDGRTLNGWVRKNGTATYEVKDTNRNVPNWTGGLEISASDLARFGLFSSSGAIGDLFVLPAWNMVIVRLGLDERKSSGGFST